ncbi:hypothetical protein RF11_15516 [Thelohanellus kitauei]|uniref:Uncharacterized protein n=1 Tax=Thelohanellus kitauei TaxID=669202 RepID=A0A0C2MZR7_THEKT|nr:hypothetical protein RF11_15516 [Thelohanellus kitauei]
MNRINCYNLLRTLSILAIWSQISGAIRSSNRSRKMRADILPPAITKTTIEVLNNHELPHEFWTMSSSYYLEIFYKLNTQPVSIEQITFIAKNGTQSFIRHKPLYDGKRLYSYKFVAAQSILYGISDLNQFFFYVDNDLNIFPAKSYEKDGLAVPSPYEPSYIFKIVVKNLTVSQFKIITRNKNFGEV